MYHLRGKNVLTYETSLLLEGQISVERKKEKKRSLQFVLGTNISLFLGRRQILYCSVFLQRNYFPLKMI